MATTKEENTSSGVSSSSDVHSFCNTHNRKPISEFQEYNEHLKKYEFHSQYRFKKPLNLLIESPAIDFEQEMNNLNLLRTNTNSGCNTKVQEYNKSCDNLIGRVSFAKQKNEESAENFDDTSDFFSNFDTQLSLVEEESSQDSEKSPNLLSYDYKSSRLVNSRNFSPPVSVKHKISQPDVENNESDSNKHIETEDSTKKNHFNYGKEKITFKEDEYELKYKALENKYKNDKYKVSKLKETFSLESFENSNSRIDSQKLKSSENDVFFDEKFQPQSQKLEISEKMNAIYENPHVSNKKIESMVENSTYNDKNNSESFLLLESEDEFKNHKSLKDKFDTDKMLNDCNDSKRKIDVKVSELYENDVPIQKNEADTESQLPKTYHNTSDLNLGVNSALKDNFYNKTAECNINGENKDYPQYLEENEIKSYTSKVIEEYKQEIASINNFHNITLQDLRNKCSDFKNKIGFSPLPAENFISANSSLSGDDVEDALVPEFIKEKAESFKDSFYKITTENKNKDIKRPEKNYTFKNINKDTYKNFKSHNLKEKHRATKTKKKTKKKDSSLEYKNKNASDDIKTKRSNYTKKNDHDTQKQEENSSYFSKANKSLIKFKAQKILLTKSSTKINHTVYLDNDRDVVSWMATQINTSSGDVSSRENTERNKLYKDSKLNEKEKPIRNSVHFEDETVPITTQKSNTFLISDEKNTEISKFSDIQDILKTDKKNEELNHTDSEIDIMKFSPPSDFSDSSEKFDLHNNHDTNNITEGNSMIADIYTTLHDIENHYNAADKEIKVTKENIENVTTEFK